MGIMSASQEKEEGPRSVCIASNAYWEPLDVKLPVLPDGMEQELVADTWENVPYPGSLGGNEFRIRLRTVMVMMGRQGYFFPPPGSCHGSGPGFLS